MVAHMIWQLNVQQIAVGHNGPAALISMHSNCQSPSIERTCRGEARINGNAPEFKRWQALSANAVSFRLQRMALSGRLLPVLARVVLAVVLEDPLLW